MSGEVGGWQLQDVREGMAWDRPFAELVRRAEVTEQEWRGMEADRVPVLGGFWGRLMNLVNDWHEEQRSRSPFN